MRLHTTLSCAISKYEYFYIMVGWLGFDSISKSSVKLFEHRYIRSCIQKKMYFDALIFFFYLSDKYPCFLKNVEETE